MSICRDPHEGSVAQCLEVVAHDGAFHVKHVAGMKTATFI